MLEARSRLQIKKSTGSETGMKSNCSARSASSWLTRAEQPTSLACCQKTTAEPPKMTKNERIEL